jgi:crotonobetainyl-CoA:carnitine CoA-transferase CaiB-like acyl-CoA transferase
MATAQQRASRRDEIDSLLAAWARDRKAPEAMETLQQAGVAAGWAQNAQHLTDVDPQLAARGWMVELQHATLGPQRHDCFPAWIDGRRLATASTPPILGQHSFEVYRELLGMSDEEIAAAIGEGLFE